LSSSSAEGKVKDNIEPQSLSSIKTIFEPLRDGDVASRVVIDFDMR
jgi:D-arabinose 1-dehydrogenase-like Zn-dependent alcohol dehydrogenase